MMANERSETSNGRWQEGLEKGDLLNYLKRVRIGKKLIARIVQVV